MANELLQPQQNSRTENPTNFRELLHCKNEQNKMSKGKRLPQTKTPTAQVIDTCSLI